jgi:hypothetical protein
MGHFASVGWAVFDANGHPVGIVARLSEPQAPDGSPASNPDFDEPTMMIDAIAGAPWAALAIPLSAIRAAMQQRLLLTEPSARFAELGWIVQATARPQASTAGSPLPGPLTHRPAPV